MCREPDSPAPGPDRQRDELVAALKAAGGNQTEAARRLGVSRVTVWKRIKKFGIRLPGDLVDS